MEERMDVQDYLKSILNKEQIKQLNTDKTIIISGEEGPSGKTTLKNVLIKKGYTVFEKYETTEIFLDNVLQERIPNFEETIS